MATKEQGLDHYKRASELGMTLWQYFELINPSKSTDNLTAFDRQLQAAGIITKSDVSRGLFSSTGEYFFQSDRPGSAILFPTLLQKTALWAKLNQVADINRIVATTRTIAGASSYQSLYIDDAAISGPNANGRRFRVDQRGKFPSVKISWSETANAVTKHGVQLDWTYEFVRRASIELMSTVVARIMMQDQQELFDEAINIAINGDGSVANPAAAVKKFRTAGVAGPNDIVLETAVTAGKISYEGYLKFIGGFKPYNINIIVANSATLTKLILMERPNIDPIALITTLQEPTRMGNAGLDGSTGSLFPNVTFYASETIADNVMVGMDTQFALERVIELGSDIQEVTRVIENQTEAMVLSIADGVSKIFPSAIQVLDFSAAPLT
jgi:hypothetical protein